MRLALVFTALVSMASTALAQFAEVQVPSRVVVAVPFAIDVTLVCPPPGEAPPPRYCRGAGIAAQVEVSDHSAFGPQTIGLAPNVTLTWGPFTFHKPGAQYIMLFAADDEFVGQASFVVQPPLGPVRRR